MHGKIARILQSSLAERLKYMPVVGILGPRQCGKSTLASLFLENRKSFLFLDLEKPSDLRKLEDAEHFFYNNDMLICIDEIQRKPDLFPAIRHICDKRDKPGQFIVLGSASRELIRQSSESLAGRISYLELTPFLWQELKAVTSVDIYHSRGGFPRSTLAENNRQSYQWRQDFIRDFLERDIPAFNNRLSVQTAGHLIQMLCHWHGQLLNANQLAGSLGVDNKTVRSYIDLLEGALIVRLLQPYYSNGKKRLIKSPKIYIRDTGLLHALLGIQDWNMLAGHPVYGHSWESMCIENIMAHLGTDCRHSFYRTSNGAEIDLLIEKGKERVAIEFKTSRAPKPERGYWQSITDLGITRNWIIAPVETGFELSGIKFSNLEEFIEAPENRDIFSF